MDFSVRSLRIAHYLSKNLRNCPHRFPWFLLSTVPPLLLLFLQIPASLTALNFDLCLLLSVTLLFSSWTPTLFLESTSRKKAGAIMLFSHVFILWRLTDMHCLCFICIVVNGDKVILLWVRLSWQEVALDKDSLCIGVIRVYTSALLWEWKHLDDRVYALFIFVFPPEHCTQPVW